MRRIMEEQVIRAWDKNRVFFELADRRALSATDVAKRYGLKRGRGNGYIEFNVEAGALGWGYNPVTKAIEHFVNGDIDLAGRNPLAFENF